jgi:hypothetical protein
MFVIRNTTDRDLVLDDLRIVLGPNKEIDLDKVGPRHQTESAPKLRLALRQRRVRVVCKDIDLPPSPETTATLDKQSLKEMEERLKAEFNRQLRRVMDKSEGGEIAALKDVVQQLVQKLTDQPAVAYVQTLPEAKSVDASTGDGVSDDIASKIHAKAVKRLEKNVSGQIETGGKKVHDETLKTNLEELEGLL